MTYDDGSSDSTEPAVITGVSITVDGNTYTSGNVIITPDSTVSLTVTGTNLQNSTEDNYITYAEGSGVPVIGGYFDFAEDGTGATCSDISASRFANSSNWEIIYYNNYTDIDNRIAVPTGIYVSSSSNVTEVSFNAKLAAVDAAGNAVTGSLRTMFEGFQMDNESQSYLTMNTGIYELTFDESDVDTVIPEGYKAPDAITLTVTDDGNGNGIVTSSDAAVSTETVEGETVYVITVTLEAEGTTVVEAKWGADADSLTNEGTLADAIAAAAADSTIRYIRLQSDVSGSFYINAGTFTIDLNGKTITSDTYTIDVRNSGTVVTLTDSVSGGAVISTGSSISAVYVTDGGKVVINGGSYSGYIAVMIDSYGGSVEINGGSFSAAWASVSVMCVTTVTGGTFGNGNEGAFNYGGGLLDLSGYTGTVTDLKVSQWTGADLAVTDENIKLPAGYTFADSEGNAVTTLTSNTVYSIAPEVVKYLVKIGAIITNGTVTVDKESAAEGETVTLTATPAEGYVLHSWSVTSASDGSAVTVNADNTFTMPADGVNVCALFLKPGTDLTKLYFNNGGSSDWTNVIAWFYDSENGGIGSAELSIEPGESSIYATTEIPEWAVKVVFTNNVDLTEYVEIPMAADNIDQYNYTDGTWSKFTATEQSTISAEITWGSMAFTYTDGSGWANDGSDGAGTVTVKNTGDTAFSAQPVYTAEADYDEITGNFYDSADAEQVNTMGVALVSEASHTFYLKLFNQPEKAIPAGTKIGTVTIQFIEGSAQ